MKFQFSLKTLLQYRKRLEDEAQRNYLEAQNNVNRCLNEIQMMYERIEEIRVENSRLEQSQNLNKMGSINANHEFIDGQKIKIERKRLEARELMQISEEMHEKLIKAAREHKVLVKLRERKYATFLEEKKKREEKELNDIVTMRFKRGVS